MQRQLRFAIAAIVVFACLAAYARGQSLDSILNATDKTNLEILATHTAQKIRDADRTEKEPRVLVIDFFLGSPGVSSSLGSSLADRFSESLANSSRKMEAIDRKEFSPGCRYIGRELGATGIVLGACMNKTARLV